MKQKKNDDIKAVVSIYYGFITSAWVYICPPYIEVTPFENLLSEDQYDNLFDYFPDIVVVNKHYPKILKQTFSSCPIIQVRSKDVKSFFSHSYAKINGKDLQPYSDYYKRISKYFEPLQKASEKALKQCVFTVALYDWKYFLDNKLWVERMEENVPQN